MMDWRAWALALSVTAVCLTLLGLSIWLHPSEEGLGTHTQLGLKPCAYYVRTGQPCMSCGMTTAYANMAHGRIVPAWHANPMGILLFCLTVATPIYLIRCMIKRKHPFLIFETRYGRWLPAAVVIAILATWILRQGLPRGI